jgi:CHAD domain-containing protein
VVEERERRRATMLKRLDRVKVDKLDRRLEAVAEALQDAKSERWRDALASRLSKRAKGLGATMEEAGQMYSPEGLHQVRIATKKLRYSLEIAAEGGFKQAAPLVRQLKKAQDTLGRLHDLQVLLVHVEAVQSLPPSRKLPEGSLAVVARALEDECRHLHGRYIFSTPALPATVEACRSVVAQLLRPSGRSRSLKMALTPRPGRAAATPRVAAAARQRQ